MAGALRRAVSSRLPWSCLPSVALPPGRSLGLSPAELQLTARLQGAATGGSPALEDPALSHLFASLNLSPTPVSLPTAFPIMPLSSPLPPLAPHTLHRHYPPRGARPLR